MEEAEEEAEEEVEAAQEEDPFAPTTKATAPTKQAARATSSPQCDRFSMVKEQFRHGHIECDFSPASYSSWKRMPDLCLYMNMACPSSHHLLGYDNAVQNAMQLSWADIIFIDFVLASRQDIRSIVEVGTFGGVSSLYLGLISKMRGGQFHTFDIDDQRPPRVLKGWLENMHFYEEDVLFKNPSKSTELELNEMPKNKRLISLLKKSEKEPLVVFFDSVKCLETKMYLQYLAKKPGSVFFVHDWYFEVGLDCLQETLDNHNFIPLYDQFAEHLGSAARAFHQP